MRWEVSCCERGLDLGKSVLAVTISACGVSTRSSFQEGRTVRGILVRLRGSFVGETWTMLTRFGLNDLHRGSVESRTGVCPGMVTPCQVASNIMRLQLMMHEPHDKCSLSWGRHLCVILYFPDEVV